MNFDRSIIVVSGRAHLARNRMRQCWQSEGTTSGGNKFPRRIAALFAAAPFNFRLVAAPTMLSTARNGDIFTKRRRPSQSGSRGSKRQDCRRQREVSNGSRAVALTYSRIKLTDHYRCDSHNVSPGRV